MSRKKKAAMRVRVDTASSSTGRIRVPMVQTPAPRGRAALAAIKPRYSGPLSKPFWRRVNALSRVEQRALYAAGILLQNMETSVLQWLANAEVR